MNTQSNLYNIINSNGKASNVYVTASNIKEAELDSEIKKALNNDMNIPAALSLMHEIAREYNKNTNIVTKSELAAKLLKAGKVLGLLTVSPTLWFQEESDVKIDSLIEKRKKAKEDKNWAEADKIRKILQEQDIVLEDHPDGSTTWRKN